MDYGESDDVQKVHAAIQREKQEPRVGLEPLSLWLIGIYALAVFLAALSRSLLRKLQWRKVWIQAQFRPNHTGLVPVAVASSRRRNFPRRSAAKKFLWRIARCAIKRADSDRRVRVIRRLPVLKLPNGGSRRAAWS